MHKTLALRSQNTLPRAAPPSWPHIYRYLPAMYLDGISTQPEQLFNHNTIF